MPLLTAFIRFADIRGAALGLSRHAYEPLDIRTAISLAPTLGQPRNLPRVSTPACRARWSFQPTLLMGFALNPAAVVQTSLTRIGRRVSACCSWPMSPGACSAPCSPGWLLLDKVGTAGTMKLLAILAGLFGVLAVVLALRASSSSWAWSR